MANVGRVRHRRVRHCCAGAGVVSLRQRNACLAILRMAFRLGSRSNKYFLVLAQKHWSPDSIDLRGLYLCIKGEMKTAPT